MIWAKEETLSRSEIEQIQLDRLKKLTHYVYDNVEPYRKKMDDAGISPDDIQSLDDLKRLPFTTKQDFRDNYPFGLFAVGTDKLARIHASSGTTGKPTVVGYTPKDLEVWAECVARLAVAGGANSSDVCQICFGYGMFTGALGLHKGLEHLGACIIPSSTGNSEKQIMYMHDYGATLLVATPSYALRLGEVAISMGLDPKKDLKLRTALVGSELMTEAMRAEMYKLYG
ncbi:MAG: phenylacetate--CoA ligase, partial [Oscillospiraceae bacterium]|nr:phenylacetate--CoA ligase [Oscillospiraceae bacterium]